MNTTLIPVYFQTILAKFLLKTSKDLRRFAGKINTNRSLTDAQSKILKRNKKFKDIHKGKPGYVIVNGPSLAQQDISVLGDEITFVVSGFWKHSAVFDWQPTYYSLCDAAFFSNKQEAQNFYKELHSRVKSTTFFVPLYRGYDAVRKFNILPAERTYYLATIGDDSDNDLTGIVQGFGSVSAFALSQAIYMGCNPIYLLGFDHDYLANRGLDRHFYAGGTISGNPQENVSLEDRIPYEDEMKANLYLWKNYKSLYRVAKKNGQQIINCTRGGYLDVFPRMEFEKIKMRK